ALPDPVLVLLLRQRVDVEQDLPVGSLLPVLLQRGAPPQATGMGLVLPEVVEVGAAAADQRDALVSVEHQPDLGAQLLAPCPARQRRDALRVALPPPPQRAPPGSALQPLVWVLVSSVKRLAHPAIVADAHGLIDTSVRLGRPR